MPTSLEPVDQYAVNRVCNVLKNIELKYFCMEACETPHQCARFHGALYQYHTPYRLGLWSSLGLSACRWHTNLPYWLYGLSDHDSEKNFSPSFPQYHKNRKALIPRSPPTRTYAHNRIMKACHFCFWQYKLIYLVASLPGIFIRGAICNREDWHGLDWIDLSLNSLATIGCPGLPLFHITDSVDHHWVRSWWRHQNGNIFHVTGLLCGEFAGHRWIPRTKASDAELWCFLWPEPE